VEREILENLLLSKYFKIDANKEKVFKIIPELKAEDGFDQKHPHHCFNVWDHTMEALKRSKPDLQIRIALLLHDIGKPYSYQEDGDIRHFRGHPQKSAEISKQILQRLGYSDKEVEDLCYLINNHNTLIDINKVNENNLELTKKLLYIQYCDAYAHHPEHIEERIERLDRVLGKLEKQGVLQ
jgi:tRNA nucleotidyltransferase (CCA-adding enzyme)